MTTYPNIKNYVAQDARETSQLDDVRTSWIAAYRQNHPEADWWAEGFGTVEHSLETQERVFRMAEQLVGRGIGRLAVFAALRHADGVAQASGGRLHEGDLQTRHLYLHGRPVRSDDYRRDPWSSSLFAAAAGCGVIDTLLGPDGVAVNLLPPEAFEEQLGRAGQRWLPQPQAGRAIILLERAPQLDHLRARGFDPIVFDGADPAAFAWAIFELASRAEAAESQLSCVCHPVFRPVPLGIAVDAIEPCVEPDDLADREIGLEARDSSCTPIRALAAAGFARASTSPIRIEPESGRTSPSIALSVLVFPPFGPRRPKISPSLMLSDTPSTARLRP